MSPSGHPLQAAAASIAFLSVLGGCTDLDTLVLSTVTIGLGIAPESVSRALALLDDAFDAVCSMSDASWSDLFAASREAFVGALRTGSGLAAAVFVAGAVLGLRLLREARGSTAAGPGLTG
jgi:hypothetical protein